MTRREDDSQPEPEEAQRPPDLHHRLAAAKPVERAELVRQLIAAHPFKPLALSTCDGLRATLEELDFSPQALINHKAESADASCPWWNSEIQAANLRGAQLQGANLRAANLQGADLTGADLRGAILREARLEGTRLEHANLSGADLAGANLSKALLGEANLQGALLEDADLEKAILRFADLRKCALEGANLQSADLWGADLEGAVLVDANLRSALLVESTLKQADLSGACLQGAAIGKANLRGAQLRGANLEQATLSGADLEHAVLRDARLQGVDLSGCKLTHIHLGGAWLDKTRLRQDQLGGALGEELAGEYEQAKEGYLTLERNFTDLGDPDSSSWAYRKKRRMQKRAALKKALAAGKERRLLLAAHWFMIYLSDQFAEWVCDYGESISRVLASWVVCFIFFTLSLYFTGGVIKEINTPQGVTLARLSFTEVVTYSLLSMTTASTPPGNIPQNEYISLLLGIEALTGIFLAGLLGFVVGNRIRR